MSIILLALSASGSFFSFPLSRIRADKKKYGEGVQIRTSHPEIKIDEETGSKSLAELKPSVSD